MPRDPLTTDPVNIKDDILARFRICVSPGPLARLDPLSRRERSMSENLPGYDELDVAIRIAQDEVARHKADTPYGQVMLEKLLSLEVQKMIRLTPAVQKKAKLCGLDTSENGEAGR